MDERGELDGKDQNTPSASDELDEALSSEIIRGSDGARISLLPYSVEINRSPHAVGERYVTEGIVHPAKVVRTLYMRHGRTNTLGVGREYVEEKTEQVPLVVIAQQNGTEPWIDVQPMLQAAGTLMLDGKTVSFVDFTEFDGAMDLQTVTAIIKREHVYSFSPRPLFEAVRSEVRRLLELDECASTVLALWTAMTYVHDAFDAFPYLWFNGVRGSGKTRALELIKEIAYHAEMNMKMSNAALFREVDQHKCTLCYDEAENLLIGTGDRNIDQERISLFNSGYKTSGLVRLVEKDGDNYVTRKFRSYSPKALASIQAIDETLQSRCLQISMMVALDPTKAEEDINAEKCAGIRKGLYCFRFAEGVSVYSLARDPEKNRLLRKEYDLKNRDWELFKPLLIGANIICSEWLPDIANFIDSQKIIRKIDTQFSTDATVLYKLLELAFEGENAVDDASMIVSYKDLLASLKDEYPELKWMHRRSLGNCLRRLGLGGMTVRYKTGYVVKLERILLEQQARRLGLDDLAISQKLQPHKLKREGLDAYAQATANET